MVLCLLLLFESLNATRLGYESNFGGRSLVEEHVTEYLCRSKLPHGYLLADIFLLAVMDDNPLAHGYIIIYALFHLGLQFCKSIKVAESCTSSDIVDGRSFLLLALLACYLLGFVFSAKLAFIHE